PLGHRSSATDLRERPSRSCRAGREAYARRRVARALSGRLQAPRLSANQSGVQRAAGAAGTSRPGSAKALLGGRGVARGLCETRRTALSSAYGSSVTRSVTGLRSCFGTTFGLPYQKRPTTVSFVGS